METLKKYEKLRGENILFLKVEKDIPEIRAYQGDQVSIVKQCGIDQKRIMHAIELGGGKFQIIKTEEINQGSKIAHPVIGVYRNCEKV